MIAWWVLIPAGVVCFVGGLILGYLSTLRACEDLGRMQDWVNEVARRSGI